MIDSKTLAAIIDALSDGASRLNHEAAGGIADDLIGQYVLVRCRDAGVHCGFLRGYDGRSVVLRDARRLWYWKPARGGFLSAVSEHGLDDSSKVGTPQRILLLTETCEIAACSPEAMQSIKAQKVSHEDD